MSERDDDLARLAAQRGWRYLRRMSLHAPAHFAPANPYDVSWVMHVPAPDAPLPEALAFVGRIAEAGKWRLGVCNEEPVGWAVSMWTIDRAADRQWQYDTDLAWAAVRAALAARGAT